MNTFTNRVPTLAVLLLLGGAFFAEAFSQPYYASRRNGDDSGNNTCTVFANPCTFAGAVEQASGNDIVGVIVRDAGDTEYVTNPDAYSEQITLAAYRESDSTAVSATLRLRGTISFEGKGGITAYETDKVKTSVVISASEVTISGLARPDVKEDDFENQLLLGKGVSFEGDVTINIVSGTCPIFGDLRAANGDITVEGTCKGEGSLSVLSGDFQIEDDAIYVADVLEVSSGRTLQLDDDINLHLIANDPGVGKFDEKPQAKISGTVSGEGMLYIQVQEEAIKDTSINIRSTTFNYTKTDTLFFNFEDFNDDDGDGYVRCTSATRCNTDVSGSGVYDNKTDFFRFYHYVDDRDTTFTDPADPNSKTTYESWFAPGEKYYTNFAKDPATLKTFSGWANDRRRLDTLYQITGGGRVDLAFMKTTQAGVYMSLGSVGTDGGSSTNQAGLLVFGSSSTGIQGDFNNVGAAQTEFLGNMAIGGYLSVSAEGADTKGIGYVNKAASGVNLDWLNDRSIECYGTANPVPNELPDRSLTTGVYFHRGGSMMYDIEMDNVGKSGSCYGGFYFFSGTVKLPSVMKMTGIVAWKTDARLEFPGKNFDFSGASTAVVGPVTRTAVGTLVLNGMGNQTVSAKSKMVFAKVEISGSKAPKDEVVLTGAELESNTVIIRAGQLVTNGMLDVEKLFLYTDYVSGGEIVAGSGMDSDDNKSVYGAHGRASEITYAGSLPWAATGEEMEHKMALKTLRIDLATATTVLRLLADSVTATNLYLDQGEFEIMSDILMDLGSSKPFANIYVEKGVIVGSPNWNGATKGVTVHFSGDRMVSDGNVVMTSYAGDDAMAMAMKASAPDIMVSSKGSLTVESGLLAVGSLTIASKGTFDLAGNDVLFNGNIALSAKDSKLCDSEGLPACTMPKEAYRDVIDLAKAFEKMRYDNTADNRLAFKRVRERVEATQDPVAKSTDTGGMLYFTGASSRVDLSKLVADVKDETIYSMAHLLPVTVYGGGLTIVGAGKASSTTAPKAPDNVDVLTLEKVSLTNNKASQGKIMWEGFDHVIAAGEFMVNSSTVKLNTAGGHPQAMLMTMMGMDVRDGSTLDISGHVLSTYGDYVQGDSSKAMVKSGVHYSMGSFMVEDALSTYMLRDVADSAAGEPKVCSGNMRTYKGYEVSRGLMVYGDYSFHGSGDVHGESDPMDEQGLRGTVTFANTDSVMVSSGGAASAFCDVVVDMYEEGTAGTGTLVMGSDMMQSKHGSLTLHNGVIASAEDMDHSWVFYNGYDTLGVIRSASRNSYFSGTVTRMVEMADPGDGEYAYPVGTAVEMGPDYYQPLMLQFPGDLARSTMVGVTSMSGMSDMMQWPDDDLVVGATDGGTITLDNYADMFWKVEVSDATFAHDPILRLAADGLYNVFDFDRVRIVQWDCDGSNARLAGAYDAENPNDYVNGVPYLTQEGVGLAECSYFGIASNFLENPIGAEPILTGTARVQFIHNVVGATVDLYLDDNKIVDDFAFQSARAFGVVAAGVHKVDIVPAPAPDNSAPLFSQELRFRQDTNYHVIAHGNVATGLVNVAIREGVRTASVASNKVDFYMVHGASGLGTVDIRTLDPIDNTRVIDLLANNFSYDDVGTYLTLDPAAYNFEVTTPNNDTQIEVFRFELQEYLDQAFVLNLSGAGQSAADGLTIMGVDQGGNTFFPQVITATEEELPTEFALLGNYPNPFNPSTRIVFDLPETAQVSIAVFDLLGRNVMTLPAQELEAGRSRTVELKAASLASGSYFYRVVATGASGRHIEIGRMLLIK